MSRGCRRAGLAALVAVLTWGAWAPARAEEPMYYYVDGTRVVITNSPNDEPVRRIAEPQRDGRPAPRALPTTIFDPYIEIVARENGLSPDLIKAVAVVESNFDTWAESSKGAQGLMQLMPATARQYGVSDAFDPLENLRAGARHLRYLLDLFEGDLTLALAAYNAGEGAVRRKGGVPNYRETRDYVRKVKESLAGRRLPRGQSQPPPEPVRLELSADGTLTLVN